MKTSSLLVAAGLLTNSASVSHAQVLEQWTHQAAIGEASAAVAMDANYMFVADNEDEVLRLYTRHPCSAYAAPIHAFDARPDLAPLTGNPEADLEAAVKVIDGTGARIYWIGSHSNSKTGKSRPDRNRIFATQVDGDGSGALPYSLSYVGRYDHLRDDLKAWDQDNLHGLGANYFGLAASMTTGVLPTWINGFNIEGLVLSPDGATAYLAFRAPLVNGSGPTTALEQRTNALVIPLLNMPALVSGQPTAGPGSARFGTPFTLSLGGRGVRSIDSSHPGHYLITAGPVGETSYPPAAPYNFRLFTWTGSAAASPIEQATEFPYGLSPEGAMLPPGPITSSTVAQFVSDDTGGWFRSFTACVAPVNTPPTLTAIPDRAIVAGATLAFAARATDSDAPAQQLTFALSGAPAGASIGATDGVFIWRPSLAQCETVNPLKVIVADNGTPSLCATQTFILTVTRPAPAGLQAVHSSHGQFQLLITGEAGPDYAIQATTDFTDWTTVFATNSPALPFTWTDPNAGQFAARFYRIVLGPR